jgi:hypothetical protein
MRDRIGTLLEGRRSRLSQLLGRPLAAATSVVDPPLSPSEREHLVSDGLDLYWNDLSWEHLTEEERVAEGDDPLIEMAFPGFLAYVKGLLLTEAMPDSLVPAQPRPEAVEEILRFLAGRIVELKEGVGAESGDPDQTRFELIASDRLLDLVLFRLHGLDAEEVEQVEAAAGA